MDLLRLKLKQVLILKFSKKKYKAVSIWQSESTESLAISI